MPLVDGGVVVPGADVLAGVTGVDAAFFAGVAVVFRAAVVFFAAGAAVFLAAADVAVLRAAGVDFFAAVEAVVFFAAVEAVVFFAAVEAVVFFAAVEAVVFFAAVDVVFRAAGAVVFFAAVVEVAVLRAAGAVVFFAAVFFAAVVDVVLLRAGPAAFFGAAGRLAGTLRAVDAVFRAGAGAASFSPRTAPATCLAADDTERVARSATSAAWAGTSDSDSRTRVRAFFTPATTSFSSSAGLNVGTVRFLDFFLAPLSLSRSKTPSPLTATFSPAASDRWMPSTTESSACCATSRLPSKPSAMRSISFFFPTVAPQPSRPAGEFISPTIDGRGRRFGDLQTSVRGLCDGRAVSKSSMASVWRSVSPMSSSPSISRQRV